MLEEYFSLKSEDPICDISYNSGRDQLLLGTENRKLSFLSLTDGQVLLSFNWDHLGNTLSFSKFRSYSTSLAAIACSDNSILLVDINTGKKLNRYFGHIQNISGLEFSKDGNSLFSCGEDGILISWKITEPSIPRSSSEGILNAHSIDLPSEYVPAWVRRHSKSDVPSLTRSIIPQGRWAQVRDHLYND